MTTTTLDAAALATVTGGADEGMSRCREYTQMSALSWLANKPSLQAMYDGMSEGCREAYRSKHPDVWHRLWSHT